MWYTPKDAPPATADCNREAVARHDMGDRQDVFGADRGFITGFPDRKVLARPSLAVLLTPNILYCA